MTHEQFLELFERRFSQARQVLNAKSAEYAQNGDKLHNFKAAAGITGGTAASACWGFLAKHLVSVRDIAHNFPAGKVRREYLDEKLGDAVNYLILLEAILIENQCDAAA